MLNTFQQQPHDALVRSTPDELSRQEFAKSLKHYIQKDILPGVGTVYGARAAKQFEKDTGHPIGILMDRLACAYRAPKRREMKSLNPALTR